MATDTIEDSKVCHDCTAVAPADQEWCAVCGSASWGPIPRELAWTVQPQTQKGVPGPHRLAGYRAFSLLSPNFTNARADELPSIPRKDPELAAMLASLTGLLGIWGIGHIYVGKVATGILLMLTGAAAWALFTALMHLEKGLFFWSLAIPVWFVFTLWAYPERGEGEIRGRRFALPTVGITWTIYAMWEYAEIAFIFIALGLTMWIFLTTRAYNLAVEHNDARDRGGSSPR